MTAAAFIALRSAGALAQTPVGVYLLLLLGAGGLSAYAARKWQPGCSDRELYVRTAVQVAATTAVIYSTGWGPTLAIGYMFTLTDGITHSGSRAAKPTLVASTVGIALGQLAIALGWAPTLVSAPAVHGLGVLAALGLAFAVRNAGVAAAEKERAQAQLFRSEERFRSLVQNASDVVAVVGRDGKLVYISPAVERMIGFRPNELLDDAELVHPDDRATAGAVFSDALATPGQPFTFELRLKHADGTWRWQESTLTNRCDDPSVEGVVANFHDISERKQFEETLAYNAYHDRLTGLTNRGAFGDSLERALGRAGSRSLTTGLLFLDLDRFKVINDSLGHGIGDLVLVEVARRLERCVRGEDTIARFGGDEFTILAEDITTDEAAQMAARVIDAVGAPMAIAGRELAVTASVGVVTVKGERSADELLRNADLAMYLAKQRGRSRWELFDSEMGSAIIERYQLEADLRRAIDAGDLTVYYQPEIALSSGNLVGFEALVRWRHHDRGLILPDVFIPAAEDSGLIVAIDEQVLAAACAQLATMNRARLGPPLMMNVNVSAASLTAERVERLVQIVLFSGIDPRLLQLEVTERTAVDGSETPIVAMQLLRQHGIRLIIDDFGTGYASLDCLQRFPIDGLKIDRSFVSQLGVSKTALAIVRAVATLGQTLGLRLTAEGVESQAQFDIVRSLGCDSAQGYWLAHPLEAHNAVEFAHNATEPTIVIASAG